MEAFPADAVAQPVALGITGRANEHVSLAADGTTVAVAWAASDATGVTDVYTALSGDGGNTFAAPVRVNTTPGDARANGEQPPRVALVRTPDAAPEVVVFWIAKRGNETVLLTARSTSGGADYGASELVPGTNTAGNRGWQALGTDGSGHVDAVWLDHRRLATPAGPPPSHQHHDATATTAAAAVPDDGVAMAQRSDLYFARLGDTPAPRALTAGVCYCCKTSIAHAPDGTIYLAWRHVYPGNMRDIAFTASHDGGQTFGAPVRVSEDGWSIAGCPDDGPSMAVDAGGRVHVVWPTVVSENGRNAKRLFHAVTTDGRTFSPRVAVSRGEAAHHPQIAAAGHGTVVVGWDEFAGDQRVTSRALGAFDENGAMVFTDDPAWSPVEGRYPALVAVENDVVTAWVSGQGAGSTIRVHRTAARR